MLEAIRNKKVKEILDADDNLKEKVEGEEDSDDKKESEEEDEEEEDDDEYGEDDDSNEDDDENENEENKKMSLKEVFKYLLPTFLFTWEGKIKMEPELSDIKAYCEKNQDQSYYLMSFKSMVNKVYP